MRRTLFLACLAPLACLVPPVCVQSTEASTPLSATAHNAPNPSTPALITTVLSAPRLSARALWAAWPSARVSPADPWALKHADLRKALTQLQTAHPGLFTIEEEGLSAEGRRIPVLRLGTGPTKVLLWSQMHGDEPTATSALLDLLNWLGQHQAEPEAQALLSKLSLWIIPMLNPDGAQRTQRRNAQELDINRDAQRLASPEGRFLKALRDRVQPLLGYNLHNQNPDLLAGKGGHQVAISLLAVPGDEAFTETPGVRRTKQLALTVQRLVGELAPDRVSRYDMDYTARAFGDSMTRWGTSTLLIETGGWAGPGENERLVRLNFVALLGSLSAIADDSYSTQDPSAYARIPMNVRESLSSLVLRRVRLAGGRALPPFVADLSFVVPGPFAGDQRRREPSVVEVGDLAPAQGLLELDGADLLALPWPLAEVPADWTALCTTLGAQNLLSAEEPRLLTALHARGPAATVRPGYTGVVLLYRPGAAGKLNLEGAVLRGRLVGRLSPKPAPILAPQD